MPGNAEGAIKRLAGRAGISVGEYRSRMDRDQRRCTVCKEWRRACFFGQEASRADGIARTCQECRRGKYRLNYRPIEDRKPYGPAPLAARDGDRLQARHKVNHLIDAGKIPDPNSLPCVDCGHLYASGQPRHEYDHYLGYGGAHHEDVQPVCVPCHHRRERERGR